MRLSVAAVAVAASLAPSVVAFKDTSPFLMFSTSLLPDSLHSASRLQLQSSSSVLATTKEFLKTCPSQLYLIISQPGVTSAIVAEKMHHLKMATENPGVKSRYSVSEVSGLKEGDAESLVRFLHEECGSSTIVDGPTVDSVLKRLNEGENESVVISSRVSSLAAAGDKTAKLLGEYDDDLYDSILKYLPGGNHYTVIFTTTPTTSIASSHQVITYDPEFQDPFHMDLKRDVWTNKRSNESNSTDFRPLFEKYNYFGPGLFMGLGVSLLLLAILSVGISAVASLEVSYGAFEKEMGPAAQKKQQ